MKNPPEIPLSPIPEEELILHFYGESADPQAIDRALGTDPELRARFESLTRELHAAASVGVPDPPADLSARVWRELQPRIARRRGFFGMSFSAQPGFALAAATLVLVAALAIGYVVGRRAPAALEARVPAVPAAPEVATGIQTGIGHSPEARERMLLASVESHLAGSERLLTRVANAAPTDAQALAEESAWAEALVSSNRLYRRAAERSGQRRIVALLDELEPLLLELAHSSDAAPDDVQAAQRRIDNTDLLFKLRVTGERLQRDAGTSRATPRTVS
ncbi:MAG: hypothetical protein ABI639_14415 [Thermoanaerobaculia bacterium]